MPESPTTATENDGKQPGEPGKSYPSAESLAKNPKDVHAAKVAAGRLGGIARQEKLKQEKGDQAAAEGKDGKPAKPRRGGAAAGDPPGTAMVNVNLAMPIKGLSLALAKLAGPAWEMSDDEQAELQQIARDLLKKYGADDTEYGPEINAGAFVVGFVLGRIDWAKLFAGGDAPAAEVPGEQRNEQSAEAGRAAAAGGQEGQREVVLLGKPGEGAAQVVTVRPDGGAQGAVAQAAAAVSFPRAA